MACQQEVVAVTPLRTPCLPCPLLYTYVIPDATTVNRALCTLHLLFTFTRDCSTTRELNVTSFPRLLLSVPTLDLH